MKKQGFLLLLIVFLGGAWLLISSSQNSVEKPTPEKITSLKKVEQFEIHNFANKFEFEKRDDGMWWVRQSQTKLGQKMNRDFETSDFKKADSIQVTQLLTRLELLRLTTPVTTLKTKTNQFHINEYSLKVVLKKSNGDILDEVFIGKPGPVLNSTYVKRGDLDSVYLVEENIYEVLPLKFSEWLQNSKEDL